MKWILYCVLCFVLSYIYINIYNLVVGGHLISPITYMYPLDSAMVAAKSDGTTTFNAVAYARVKLPNIYTRYILFMVVFFFAGFDSLRRLFTQDMPAEQRKQKLITLALGVSGIMEVIVIVNRASVNYGAARIQFILLLAIYAQQLVDMPKDTLIKMYKTPYKMFKLSLSFIAFYLLIIFSIDGVLGVSTSITHRLPSLWNTTALKNDVEAFKEKVPKDTLAIGTGLPELYFQLGWDPQIVITDWSDMNVYSRDETERVLKEADSFIKLKEVLYESDGNRGVAVKKKYEIPEGFYEAEEIVTEDMIFSYYKRGEDPNKEEQEQNDKGQK